MGADSSIMKEYYYGAKTNKKKKREGFGSGIRFTNGASRVRWKF